MVAIEGVPLHSPYFAKLWFEIYHSEVTYLQFSWNNTVHVHFFQLKNGSEVVGMGFGVLKTCEM